MLNKQRYIKTPVVSEFILFMADIIVGKEKFEHTAYDRKRHKDIRYNTLENAFDDYYWAGKDYDANEKILRDLQTKLSSAEGESFEKEVKAIFKWGRVQSCAKWIDKQPSSFELKESVEKAISVIQSDTPNLNGFGAKNSYRMNSGFTKFTHYILTTL